MATATEPMNQVDPITSSGPKKMEVNDDDSIDNNEIEEYREMIEELGTFPNKVLINSLTMVAEDHADSNHSAKKIYDCIREKLLSAPGDYKLPIIYVIDSILKNAKGAYIKLFEDDASNWMGSVYRKLPNEASRAKMKRVYKTWSDFSLFSLEKWKAMGECFADDGNSGNTLPIAGSPLGVSTVAGIPRSKTGSLILSTTLRKEMQKILDELQNDIDNELEKVSLERLADINQDLLANIKKAAEDALLGKQSSSANGVSGVESAEDLEKSILPSFLTEFRSEDTVQQSKAWSKLDLKHADVSNEIIHALKTCVQNGSSHDARYTQSDAIDMTHVLAAASTAATLLSKALERRESQAKMSNQNDNLSFSNSNLAAAGGATASGYSSVDKALFTNEGLRKKNLALIGLLYEVGLPFVSSSDGRRFQTQLDLSKHLDRLFKKSQIEKSMARTEERGWYVSDRFWTGESSADEAIAAAGTTLQEADATSEDDADPDSFTEIADESRDKCVICGINFKMFFDNDDGAYKYRNCHEIEVMNDDVAENESDMMLVHVTCWRGLGSPATLDIDQTLRE